ncbi:hypothetical protein M5D98_11570 [Mesorhizobium opportunistum]|nr:hypothetical protein [Mesorhizobium opportunistum]UQS66917.1 hypothetical protein M5D98_11570 [Mesorhizobium opportunistum]
MRLGQFRYLGIGFILSLSLSGCVGAQNVQSAEVKVFGSPAIDPRSYAGNVEYAKRLADEYMRLSDRASSAQDAAALGLIASAGVAAGGLLYGGSTDLIKGAGLAAGSLGATTTYFSPGKASSDLLDAAEQLLCISKVSDPPPYDQVTGSEIIRQGVMTVRLNLRKKLNHTLPDYKQLVETLKTSISEQSAAMHITNQKAVTLEDLKVDVNKCVL